MTELRFHRELYRGESVDEAVKTYARFGTFELAEEPTHWVVKVSCKTPARERQVAGELGNTALGLSLRVRSGRSAGAAK
jgi:hypothetical protein